jgi:hypothetical protein
MITGMDLTKPQPGLGDQKDQKKMKHLALTAEHTKLLDS